MARFAFQSPPQGLPISTSVLRRWVPALGVWGVAAGAGVTLFMSDVPVFRQDVLHKIPLLRTYFIDTTPASDKPF
ncbi:hypothetical protein DL93DRAFT_2170872 [Clavulina sp. PMI_390]|nr:hypothetical protein DL93DRAFT_2170872 [Clavulina sp. PMI_390]